MSERQLTIQAMRHLEAAFGGVATFHGKNFKKSAKIYITGGGWPVPSNFDRYKVRRRPRISA
jgi:hypothetical protein